MPADHSHPGLLTPSEIDEAAFLEGIVEWVRMETPSDRPDLIERFFDHVQASFEGLPVSIRRLPPRGDFGGHMVLTYAPGGSNLPPVLVMGHIDTVWAAGTLERRPIRREGDRVYGPGIYDMKAGSYIATETLRQLAMAGHVPPRPIVVLLNSDEEIGSDSSRSLIEELASKAAFVLVPEPAVGPRIAAVTSRKGWGRFWIRAHGRSAHAGGNLAEGRSAIREIARQIIDIEGLNGSVPEASFNVGTIRGGTRGNVVPAEAEIEVDMRMTDAATGERMMRHILSLTPHDPDVRLAITGGINRPPFLRSPAVGQLYESTRTLAGELGFELPETARGGVSDGNFAAALGRPVLDGLGCGGHGAHAEDEHILVSTIASRAALIHAMLVSADFQSNALGRRN
ncbi:MAG TPA: M20 family metallopeptidase [Rhizobiaceae bacterium]|nr:M20 family metallopeptidase [Rhizobiaceae bacterium]